MSQLDAEGVVETGGSSNVSLEGWLKSNGLEVIAPVFKQAGLALDDLLLCSADDVRDLCAELNVKALHRVKLIAKLKKTPGSSTSEERIVFLGDKEKEMLDQSFKKTEVISNDIQSIQTAIIDLEESAVECTKEVNTKCDAMISMVQKQRESLLNTITELKTQRKSELESMLKRLQSMNESAISAQKECKKIAVKADLATSSRLEQMEAALKKQEEAESKMNEDDDEKEINCQSAEYKLMVIYDENTFSSNLESALSVAFSDNQLALKSMDLGIQILKFSAEYISSDHLTLSDENRCVTHSSSNTHRYVLADVEPVTKGVHCWRIHVE